MTLPQRVRFLSELLLTYVQVRYLLREPDIRSVVARLRRSPGGTGRDSDVAVAVHLGRLVQRGLRPLPSDTRCLTQSLVLLRLLDARCIPSTLVLGVRTAPAFGAHAWLEVAGCPVLEAGDVYQDRLLEA